MSALLHTSALMNWRIVTERQSALSNAVTFRLSGCWPEENASERWQRAPATVLTGFGFLRVATTRMGRRDLPISGNRTQALQRFFPMDKRISYANCLSKSLL